VNIEEVEELFKALTDRNRGQETELKTL